MWILKASYWQSLSLMTLTSFWEREGFAGFWHVERSNVAVRTACDIEIGGRRRAGRPKITWKKLTEKDCREWKLTTVDPQERSTWRSGVRSAMHAASQLSGRGPTDVDDAPARLSNIWLWWWWWLRRMISVRWFFWAPKAHKRTGCSPLLNIIG